MPLAFIFLIFIFLTANIFQLKVFLLWHFFNSRTLDIELLLYSKKYCFTIRAIKVKKINLFLFLEFLKKKNWLLIKCNWDLKLCQNPLFDILSFTIMNTLNRWLILSSSVYQRCMKQTLRGFFYIEKIFICKNNPMTYWIL